MTATAPRLEHVPLDRLHPSPFNPRKHFDPHAIAELAASMRENGQFTALNVRPHPKRDGHFEIGAGESRWRAGTKLKLEQLRCEVQVLDDQAFARLVVWENIHRRNLRALEEAEGYRTLMTVGKLTVEEIAAGQEVKPDYVKDRLRLFRLTEPAKKLLEARTIELGHALELAKLGAGHQAQAIKEGLFRVAGAGPRSELLDVEETPGQAARTVAELRAWIDNHVLADLEHPDLADLFPATAQLLQRGKAEKIPQVLIATGYVRPEVKSGVEVLTPANWQRADGAEGSKVCESKKKIGIVAAGDAARTTGFLICTSKVCAVHFPDAVRRAKQKAKGEAKAVAKGKAPTSEAERYRLQEEQRRAEDRARAELAQRTRSALPAILEALAQRVKAIKPATTLDELLEAEAPARHDGAVVTKAAALVRRGSSLDDGLRRLRWLITLREARIGDDWGLVNQLPKLCKTLGVDLGKLIPKPAPKGPACVYCGCTETTPCISGGVPCAWMPGSPRRCSAPACLKKHEAATKKSAGTARVGSAKKGGKKKARR